MSQSPLPSASVSISLPKSRCSTRYPAPHAFPPTAHAATATYDAHYSVERLCQGVRRRSLVSTPMTKGGNSEVNAQLHGKHTTRLSTSQSSTTSLCAIFRSTALGDHIVSTNTNTCNEEIPTHPQTTTVRRGQETTTLREPIRSRVAADPPGTSQPCVGAMRDACGNWEQDEALTRSLCEAERYTAAYLTLSQLLRYYQNRMDRLEQGGCARDCTDSYSQHDSHNSNSNNKQNDKKHTCELDDSAHSECALAVITLLARRGRCSYHMMNFSASIADHEQCLWRIHNTRTAWDVCGNDCARHMHAPRLAEVYFWLARAFVARGCYHRAGQTYQRALALPRNLHLATRSRRNTSRGSNCSGANIHDNSLGNRDQSCAKDTKDGNSNKLCRPSTSWSSVLPTDEESSSESDNPRSDGGQGPFASCAHLPSSHSRAPSALNSSSATLAQCASIASATQSAAWCTLAEREMLLREQSALSFVCRLRSCCEKGEWTAARELLDGAYPMTQHVPSLMTQHAGVLLECGQPESAREFLVAYLAKLTQCITSDTVQITPLAEYTHATSESAEKNNSLVYEVSCAERALVSPKQGRELRHEMETHYMLTSMLLAKVTAYCGRSLMDLAAVLVGRCLTMRPNHGPALALGNYIVNMEDLFTQAEKCLAGGHYDALIETCTRGVQFDCANRRGCAYFYLLRAQGRLHQQKSWMVIEDSTRCIELDGSCARAFYLRATAHSITRATHAAAIDRAAAIHLSPSYKIIFRDELEQTRGDAHVRSASPRPPFPTACCNDTAAHTTKPPPMRRVPSLYQLLGVQPDATREEIRMSYKKLTLQYHPDRVLTEAPHVQKRATEMFQAIHNAYTTLSQVQSRARYDQVHQHLM